MAQQGEGGNMTANITGFSVCIRMRTCEEEAMPLHTCICPRLAEKMREMGSLVRLVLSNMSWLAPDTS